MSSVNFFRVAARTPQVCKFSRGQTAAAKRPFLPVKQSPGIINYQVGSAFSTSVRRENDAHGEESFEEFTARYVAPEDILY